MNEKDKERAARFGAYVRALRLARGLTQAELGAKCGYTSRAAINQIEKGRNDIAFDRLPALSDALGVEPKALFEVYTNAPAAGTDADKLATLETIRAALADLTPEQLAQILAIVKVMQAQNEGA